MQNEVNLAAKVIHGTLDKVLKLFKTRGVRANYQGTCFLCQGIDFAHAHGHGSVGKHELRALCMTLLGDLPCDGIAVEGTEHDAFFSLK